MIETRGRFGDALENDLETFSYLLSTIQDNSCNQKFSGNIVAEQTMV